MMNTRDTRYCSLCDKSIYGRTLKYHLMSKHGEGSLICKKCDEEFPTINVLYNHNKAVHRKISFKCDYCEYVSKQKVHLLDHINGVHLKEKNFKCTMCEKRYSTSSSLSVHIKSHSKIYTNCKDCGKNILERSLKGHQQEVHSKTSERKHVCVHCHCKKTFKRKDHMNEHINVVHTKTVELKCNMCKKQFTQKSNLQTHLKLVHKVGKISQFVCSICDFSSKSKSSLKKHIEVNHLGYKIKCDTCTKELTSKTALRLHKESVHLKTLKTCHQCSKQFTVHSYLSHIRRDHGNRHKIEGFECTKCDFKANFKRSLEEHITVHHSLTASLKCKDCEFSTVIPSRLNQHIRSVHLQIGRFECKLCGHKFYKQSTLDDHKMARHWDWNGEPFIQSELKTEIKDESKKCFV